MGFNFWKMLSKKERPVLYPEKNLKKYSETIVFISN